MAHRLRTRHLSRYWWRQSKRSGSFPRNSPIKAPHVCTHLLRFYPGGLASQQSGPRAGAGAAASDVVPFPVQGSRSTRRVRAATVEDADLREALLRGISETGVPTIESAWVPPSKQSEIGPTFTKIAKPTLQCMFEPEPSKP